MKNIEIRPTSLVITLDDIKKEVSLPNTKEDIAFELVLEKFDANTVADIINNYGKKNEDKERFTSYIEWYKVCNEAVKDLDMEALNAAAKEKIEADRLEAERIAAEEAEAARIDAERVASEEEAKRLEEEEERHKEEERLAPVRDFEAAKKAKLSAIEEYDKSSSVNAFTINGIDGWLDRDTRTSLTNTVSVEKAAGKEETTLWFGLNKLTMNCDLVLGMLARLEMYAHECYNVTAQHIADISAIVADGENPDYVALREQIESYDITTGYPAQLSF